MENFQTCAPQSTLETISWKQFFQWGSPADENFSMPCAPQYLEFFFRWVSSGDKKMSMYRAPQYYWGFSQLRICRPPPSVFIRFLWMMRSVLKRMKNEIHFFSDLYFLSYREKFTILLDTKIMTLSLIDLIELFQAKRAHFCTRL